MVGFRENIINLILVAIFAFALIGFGAQFAIDNKTDISILDDPVINQSYVDIQSALENTESNAETQRESWYEDVPIIKDINLVWKSLTGILRVFFTSFTTTYNVIINFVSIGTGIPEIVLNAITAVITMSMLLLLWRLVRSGS